MRLVGFLSALHLIVTAWAAPALAADGRAIVTQENGDYFGFDLRAEQNFSLDQCKTACLGDPPAAPSPTTPRRNGASSNPTTTS